MLDELSVTNLGVLRSARIEPSSRLTVITGETGAGKTMLLGALRLLLGATADDMLVGPFGEEATAEGRFLGDGPGSTPSGSRSEVGATRRLTRGGRSRAYLDGSIASAAALEEATAGRVEIIGQHDQLALTRPSAVKDAIDRLLDDEGRQAWQRYRETWERFRAVSADQQRVGGDRTALERERDLTRHQVDEIERAGFSDGDDQKLEQVLGRLRNIEQLSGNLQNAAAGLDTARDGMGETVARIRRAVEMDSSLADLVGEFEDIEGRLGLAAVTISGHLDELVDDPERLESAEARWSTLADLRRRYGPTLDDVFRYRDESSARLAELDGLLDRADRIGAELDDLQSQLGFHGAELMEARNQAAKTLTAEATEHLRELGFLRPLIVAEIDTAQPTGSGADTSRLLFSSDTRLPAGELAKIASGGELSRLVLALRLASGAADADTIVFDEIDTGIGGAVALAMGRKLAALAEQKQVLCVSHLPQVAAFADVHYVVERDDEAATVRRVDGEERRAELSRMLAGLPDSERGREAADELLALVTSR